MLALVLADLVDGDDVGVLQGGRGLRLQAETLHVLGSGELAGQDHLDGHDAVKRHLPRLVHDAHAAAAQLAQDLIARNGGQPRRRGAGGRGAGVGQSRLLRQ